MNVVLYWKIYGGNKKNNEKYVVYLNFYVLGFLLVIFVLCSNVIYLDLCIYLYLNVL